MTEYYDVLPDEVLCAPLPNNDLSVLADKVAEMEKQIVAYKTLEANYKAEKEKLYALMVEANMKSWTLPNGTTFTVVAEKPDETLYVEKFDELKFKRENESLYNEYVHEMLTYKNGRKGYLKVTVK